MQYSERLARLERFYEEGRLVRNDWGDGVECACLVSALAPEVLHPQAMSPPRRVPYDVLPFWAVPAITMAADTCTDAAWPALQRRFLRIARKLPALGPDGWGAARKRFLANMLDRAGQETLKRDEPVYLSLLTDVANVLRGDPTYMPRAMLAVQIAELRVPYDGVRSSAVVRLMAQVVLCYERTHDTALTEHGAACAGYENTAEAFLSALEEQCALAA